MDQTSKNNLDLTRLRARMAEKPRTKFGQVRQAWPHIKALFDAGHSLKDIWIWLNEIGIEIGYARLSDYAGQLKRRDQATAHPAVLPVIQQTGTGTTPECPPSLPNDAGARQIKADPEVAPTQDDPLANIRDREDRRSGFNYNSEPDVKKLI